MSLSDCPYPPVVGICGDFESGKDEIAKVLVMRYQYTRVAFADFLKEVVFNYVLSEDYPADFPANTAKIIKDHRHDPYAVYRKPTTPPIRILLQYVGTEYFRGKDEDHWVKLMRAYIRPLLDAGRRVVIPDMRYLNETVMVVEFDGDTWRAVRPIPDKVQAELRKHRSETALKDYHADFDVLNDGTLEELSSKVTMGMILALDWRARRANRRAFERNAYKQAA